MRNKYNCILDLSITKTILIALLVILPNVSFAQQSPSIQSGVTFQWADTQSNNSNPATIQSITIDGTIYNTFVVPTSYEMTQLGPDGHSPNRIRQNGSYVGGNSSQANWVANATAAFQDKNLNHYFNANPNGRNICTNFNAAATTDAQKQTIFYSPAIPSNEGAVIAVTERGGNNCFYIEVWGTPTGGGPEQKLGETFVRNSGNYRNCTFAPPISGSDYWQSGRCNENGQTIGIGLFYLDDIAPSGSNITKIEFIAATRDHGDGKFFILQKYAVDQSETNCIDSSKSGDLNILNNVPSGSTYTLVSGPTPAGQYFNLNSDGTYTYIPTSGYIGDVTFDYEVCLPAPNTSVCDTGKVTLTYIDLPPNPTYEISCNGTNDFVLTVESPTGIEFEYSLDGTNFQDSNMFSGISEGSYTIIVRNKFIGCTTSFNNNPVIIEDLKIKGTVTDILCKPNATGVIDVTVSGGEPPYAYAWSNSATSEDLSNVTAGTYTLTVTDANGCNISNDFTINQPTEELTSTIISTTDVLCFGDNNGSIDIDVSGGTSPYTYLWSTGETTQDISGLNADTYTVTITDTNGCTTTNQAIISQSGSLLTATLDSTTNIDCSANSNGSITVSASGGIAPYQYSIDSGTTNQSTGLFENLTSGSYTVLITDNNGCTTNVIATIAVNDNENPQISVPGIINLEGCSTSDITSSNAVFDFNNFGSNDIKSIFNSNVNYNASDDSIIHSITYNDVVTSTNSCSITVLRTFTITDTCGNSATTNQTITVVDTTAPTISAPADITIECGQEIPPIVDIIQSESFINSSNYSDTNNEYSVSAWFRPSNGSNYISRNFAVPNNLGFGVNGNVSGASGELGANSTGTEIIRVDFSNPQLFIKVAFGWKNPSEDALLTFYLNNQQVGTTKRHYGGNDGIESDILFTADNGEMFDRVEFSAPYSIGDSGHDYLIHTITFNKVAPQFEAATGADTCGAVTISGSDSEVANCGNTKIITRTWTVTDECGNSVSADQTITVQDTTPPTIDNTNTDNIVIQCGVTPDGTLEAWIANNAGATASDTCGNITWSNDFGANTNVDCANGAITVTFTATDECGNASNTTATYSIIDTVDPVLTIPADVTVECTESTDTSATGTATATDDCATPNVTFSDVEVDNCGNTKIITRTWTATDACGNSVSADQTITVQDTTPPTITAPADITIECTDDASSANTGVATGADTCGNVTITESDVET
ncbi:Ig-like domain-containing protein, partial [Winogradskyella sp.]|uniref:Ig-like domain-containing protein n=1 Tax=Winogradskyella sp. TaxID=1883156 RepID=UPI0025DAFAB2